MCLKSRPSFKRRFVFNTIFLLLFACLALGSQPAFAATHHHKHHAKARHHAHAGVDATASYSDIVIDAETGQIFHAANPDSIRHPASLTKMMTLYLTFQALEAGKIGFNQYLPVSANAAEQSPSKLGLRPGQRIKVEHAILGLVTESANDAAVVLAEWLGGSERGFAQLMTRQAQALGMTRTHFDNPSGLPDDDQVTTARDMAILGSALYHHYPQFYPFFSHDSFSYNGIPHHNHNHLMERYDGMDGIKTGYIRASGFNLVASAKRGHTRLIGVVFGGHSAVSRDNQMAQLLNYCFAKAADSQPKATQEAENNSNDAGSIEKANYVAIPPKVSAIFPQARPAAQAQPAAARMTIVAAPAAASGGNIQATLVSAPAVAPAATITPAHNWGIQIGAYNDPAVGRQALSNVVALMPTTLTGADPQLVPMDTAGGITLYRARLVNIDPKTAQAACASLTHQGMNCLTVGP